MSRFSNRLLTADHDLLEFSAKYSGLSGMGVDLSYLQRAKVRAFFTSDGTMVGGYIVNDNAPFRYLSAVPEDPRELLGDRLDSLRECCCIWMARGLSQWRRIEVYLHVVVDLGRGDKKYVLGGSCHPGVVAVQREGLPHMVYQGLCGDDDHQFYGWIYYGTRRTMWMGALRNIGPRIRRAAFGRPARRMPAARPHAPVPHAGLDATALR